MAVRTESRIMPLKEGTSLSNSTLTEHLSDVSARAHMEADQEQHSWGRKVLYLILVCRLCIARSALSQWHGGMRKLNSPIRQSLADHFSAGLAVYSLHLLLTLFLEAQFQGLVPY